MNIFKDKVAIRPTLHCLAGCAIGEVSGMVIGTALGWSTLETIALAVLLAFVFGYSLSMLSLVKSGLAVGAALSVALAADTISIATMEVVDNLVMVLVPGAMHAGLASPVFWLAMILALTAAFFAALPVNHYLIKRGKGHALAHKHHAHHEE